MKNKKKSSIKDRVLTPVKKFQQDEEAAPEIINESISEEMSDKNISSLPQVIALSPPKTQKEIEEEKKKENENKMKKELEANILVLNRLVFIILTTAMALSNLIIWSYLNS